ncbi:MAG: cysteine desulfurase [Deltaproteobacteria bacterium]|nr:MAG: cysteine desulfurase [Deltaproteobacteria bacterium]
MSLDLAVIRAQFPALHQQVNGEPLVYLDNAASSQVCRASIEAVRTFEEQDKSNVHRGVHTLAQRATSAMEAGREQVARFLGARSSDEIVFTRGTTEAINLVAGTLGQSFVEGDEVLITHMEHHSNIVPWQLLARQRGIVLKVAPIDDRGVLDLAALVGLIGPRTRLVSVVQTSNTLGTRNPVAEIVRAAHDAGVPVLLDGAQAAPHEAVDVAALGCDFYAFSGHKVCGPTGIGVLYGRRELLAELPPWQGGGDMIERVSFQGTTFAEPPARFEAGTPNISGIIGLGAACDYLRGVGFDAIAQWEAELLDAATQVLQAVPGLRMIGTAPDKASVCSFVLEGAPAADIGTLLDMQGVAVRAGHHCTEPLMERLGVPATARASFAFYNTMDDVEALGRGLHKVRKILG